MISSARVALATAITGSVFFVAQAEEKPAPEAGKSVPAADTPIEATVERIYETRRWSEARPESGGDLSVALRLTPSLPDAQLLRMRVTSASDDQGHDLVDPKRTEFEPDELITPEAEDVIQCTLRLKAGARKATHLTEVTGEAIFQNPASAKAPIEITDFAKSPGEFLENAALEELGVSLAYLDEATFDEKGSKLVLEAMSIRFGKNTVPPDQFEGAAAPMKMLFQMGATLLVVRDPDDRVIKIEGLDEKGEPFTASQNMIQGLWQLIPRNKEKVLTAIRVQVASKDAEFSQPFTVKDVPLP